MHAATPAVGENLLKQPVDYEWTRTPRGAWRRFMYSDGSMFAEYTSTVRFGRLPLVHITWGKCPETGRRIHAVGILAIGRRATGVLAIGQMAVGLVAIGQLALGVGFGFGQAATGCLAVGQAAMAAAFGVGQFVYSGYAAVAQMGIGEYVVAQYGLGSHVIDMRGVDPVAKDFFLSWLGQ